MSISKFDHETPATHLRRRLTRWYKYFKNIPISLKDISVIQMTERDGTSYEARRDTGGRWEVYRVYRVRHDKTGFLTQHETQGLSLTLAGALDLLSAKCPEGMTRRTNAYNHPLQVAKLIRHQFAAPAV
jgi:hypothetical protein